VLITVRVLVLARAGVVTAAEQGRDLDKPRERVHGLGEKFLFVGPGATPCKKFWGLVADLRGSSRPEVTDGGRSGTQFVLNRRSIGREVASTEQNR
jgi:hypothetical protein